MYFYLTFCPAQSIHYPICILLMTKLLIWKLMFYYLKFLNQHNMNTIFLDGDRKLVSPPSVEMKSTNMQDTRLEHKAQDSYPIWKHIFCAPAAWDVNHNNHQIWDNSHTTRMKLLTRLCNIILKQLLILLYGKLKKMQLKML